MGTRIAGFAACVVLAITSCASNSGPTPSTSSAAHPATTTATGSAPTQSALKPIDPAAFQAVVDDAAKKLLVPGAVVVVRPRRATSTRWSAPPKLGAQTPPDADTHFRIASNTKTMTAALIVLLAQDGKLQFSDPGLQVRSKCAQRQQHHHRGAAEDAQRAVQLHRRARSLGDARRRPDEGVDTAGSTGHRVPASAAVRARHLLRVQQHQLRTPGPDRREGRRPPVGASSSRTDSSDRSG